MTFKTAGFFDSSKKIIKKKHFFNVNSRVQFKIGS